ncbi:MAG: hypothetical protein ACXABK_03335, partial [Candidatus Heimdallarchaeaceae archaeon]
IQEIGLIGNTIGNWRKILKRDGKIFAEDATWNYLPQDNLPWDNINHILKKKILISAYEKYLEEMNC